MDWVKSKTTAIAGGCCLALIGLQGYGLMSVRSALDDRVGSAEREFQSARSQDETKMTQMAAALDAITQRMGSTAQELKESQALAEKLKQENTQAAQRLRRELSAKADVQAVKQFHEEATTKLNEVQQDTTA